MCNLSEEHPSLAWERGARRLQQVLIARAFRELIAAREQQGRWYRDHNFVPPPDDGELRALLGERKR